MLCPDSISTILMSQHPGMRSQVHLRKHHYKASGGDGIPVELFQILKDDAVQVLHSICQQIWKTQQWPQDWKSQFSFQSQRKAMPKNAQNSTSQASQYTNHELPDVQAGFRKGRRTRDEIANICWIIEKARGFQKNIYFCFIDYAKAFAQITTHCGKFFKRWEYRPPYLPPEKSVCRSKNNS